MNTKTVPLHLCFKGERNYLQGGDLCHAIMEEMHKSLGEGAAGFRLSFHRFITNQPDLSWTEIEQPLSKPENAAADFSINGPRGKATGWLVETKREVDCRVAFDEEKITRCCNFAGESISIQGAPGYIPIEVAVSMTKQLHTRSLPAPSGRWIFTKLELSRLFRAGDASALTITLKQNLHGRLTKSAIGVHGEPLGFIYFSLIPR